MHRFWWSSQIITLDGGNRGLGPPPTSASRLQRKSISTMPMPPPDTPPPVNTRRNVSLNGGPTL